MFTLKCKICGGDIDLNTNQTIGQCQFCGSTMTIPSINNEQRLNLFNRANYFRQQSEFDRALATYDKILNQDINDAEAHWGIVLSRYGIEYVEDPVTHERKPTCHRMQSTPVLSDPDYLLALEYARDEQSKVLYSVEANKISDIQKRILTISAKEKPYDIFICFKDTSDDGRRTLDSIYAEEIYQELTHEGWNVFYSRITLKNKLGQEYEPYIYAALNSAKVMLVLGTKPEYFNSVWVKNEWSRFYDLMKTDHKKRLIPCYSNMSAYELPDELSILQCVSMQESDYLKTIIQGIKAILHPQNDSLDSNKSTEPREITRFAEGLQAIESKRMIYPKTALFSKSSYKKKQLDLEESKIAYIQNYPIPNTAGDLLDFMILAASSIDIEVYSGTKSENNAIFEKKKALADAWFSKINQIYLKTKSIKGNTETIKKIETLYRNTMLKIKNEKRDTTIGMAIFLLIAVVLLFLASVFGSYSPFQENRRLNKIVAEIETALSNNDYKMALREAESIAYELDDKEQKRQWEIKKESLIDRIIKEAERNGVNLQRTKLDESSETDNRMNKSEKPVSGFTKGYRNAYTKIVRGMPKEKIQTIQLL